MPGEYPKDLKYTKDHEWARKVGATLQVGVTWHAQDALGAIVYVELPKVGAAVKAGESFGVVESTKAVSELFAPVTGKVVKANTAVVETPGTLNDDPYKAGWLIEIEPASPTDFDKLLDAETYTRLLREAK